jgi:hypothetical protein
MQVEITMEELPQGTEVEDIKSNIGLLTLRERKTTYQQKL